MKKTFLSLTACVLAMATPGLAHAAYVNFTATLTAADEVPDPVVPSGAIGSLTGILDTDTNVFTWTLVATGLTAPVTGAHFHGNTPYPPDHEEVTRPVVLGFIGDVNPGVMAMHDILEGNTSGLYAGSADLDLALGDRAGEFPLTVAEQINGLLGTQWYVNVHTANNPQGEIRGQVFLATPTAVPAPAVGWLTGLGIGALVARSVRRHQRG